LESVTFEVEARVSTDEPIRLIIVRADSAYLVNSISQYIYKWVNSGWLNSKGQTVANKAIFHRLHGIITDLKASKIKYNFGTFHEKSTRMQTVCRLW
jgi:ribonuclease HI